MKKTFIFALSIALATVGCDKKYFIAPAPSHLVIADDNSLSIKPDCAGLIGAARRATSGSDFPEGSTMTLIVIGASAHRPEATRLFDKKLPIAPDTVFGRDDASFAAEQVAYFRAAESACASAPPSKSSPILRLVRDSLAHLRSRGCDDKTHCLAKIQTDLQEDVDEDLRGAVSRAARNPNSDLPAALRRSIDNAGILISFCSGQAQASSAMRQASPETLQRLWRGLFTHPEAVTFAPYCGD